MSLEEPLLCIRLRGRQLLRVVVLSLYLHVKLFFFLSALNYSEKPFHSVVEKSCSDFVEKALIVCQAENSGICARHPGKMRIFWGRETSQWSQLYVKRF